MMSAGVPCGDDLAAMDAGAGADVDDIIGGEDGVLVMLDDDHGIAEVAQPPQRLEQAGIVALVQADRGLVEHIEHAGQAGADLRGEPDALAFAARQRARARATASDNRGRHRPGTSAGRRSPCRMRAAISLRLASSFSGRAVNQAPPSRTESSEISPMCLWSILTASASGLRRKPLQASQGVGRHVARDFLARPFALGLEIAPLEIADHALERLFHLIGAHAVVIGEADLLARRSHRG